MATLTREDVERIVKEAREKGERPDLSNMDLSDADLSGTDLSVVNFSEANLNRANLNETNLSGAYLDGATLDEAKLVKAQLNFVDLSLAYLGLVDLSEASLHTADLSEADLSGADFRRTNLGWANLNGTDLTEANLSQAVLGYTALANVDLSKVKGLDTAEHLGPSYIDTHTLTKSKGQIPEAFLRGCGLSDWEIENAKLYNPHLTPDEFTLITYEAHRLRFGNPIYHSCFISHSHQDKSFVEKIYTDLQENGVRCWYAPEDMKGGDKLYPQIDRAIRFHDKLLLVLSERSLKSEWVMTEIRRARKAEAKENQRKLFPIRLTDMTTLQEWECFDADTGKDLAVEVREYFIPDFSQWEHNDDAYQIGFERLLRDLQVKEG